MAGYSPRYTPEEINDMLTIYRETHNALETCKRFNAAYEHSNLTPATVLKKARAAGILDPLPGTTRVEPKPKYDVKSDIKREERESIVNSYDRYEGSPSVAARAFGHSAGTISRIWEEAGKTKNKSLEEIVE